MPAEAPADEDRLFEAQSLGEGDHRAGVTGKRVVRWLVRIVRLAVTGQIEGDKASRLAERSGQLTDVGFA
jgi:hypothetical protein